MNFGSMVTPTSGVGMGMKMRTAMRLPRIGLGANIPRPSGSRLPSVGGLGAMKLAAGGLAEGGHPSMSWLSIRDSLHSMPRHTVPDYLLARMAGGGSPEDYLNGPADPLDYPRRALSRQRSDIGLLSDELRDRPVRQINSGRMTRRPDMPNFSPMQDRLEQALMQRDAEAPNDRMEFSPEDLPLTAGMFPSKAINPMARAIGSIPRRMQGAANAGLFTTPLPKEALIPMSGPMLGGLASLLHSGEAHAPETRQPQSAQTFDPRLLEDQDKYASHGPSLFNFRRMIRSALGAR